jgi:hypothetical protein
MKKLILLALIAVTFIACQKTGTVPSKVMSASKDTIPDGAAFKVQMVKDSIYNYEVLIHFYHGFHLNYSLSQTIYGAEDVTVPELPASLNLSAITSDGVLVNFDGVPYTPGMSIPLDANAADGSYFLKTSFQQNIPSYIHFWCKDNYLKDSIDLRTGNYHFNINNADTNSFGRNRFKIVVR